MIVVDTNLVVYLLIGGEFGDAARQILLRDPEWAAPLLWRSEFRSVLAQYIRREQLVVADALKFQRKAEELFAGREYLIRSDRVLRLIGDSGCSAYDCEFVALARQLRVALVTSDRQVLDAFPAVAVSPARFLREGAS